MERLLLATALCAGAALVAWSFARLRPVAGPTVVGATPEHLDRAAFLGPSTRWLIAVFTSNSCLACGGVLAAMSGFESGDVTLHNIEVAAEPELHRRYRIDSVPTTLLADAAGIVRGAWVGPLSVDDRQALHRLLSDE